MLHLYYQEFLGVRLPGCQAGRRRSTPRKDACSDGSDRERLAVQERLEAQRNISTVDQLREAFDRSDQCQQCRLNGEVFDFAEWRAKALKELALHSSIINCWVHILAAPFDWKSVRYDPCLCPFAFGYWGLRWQPANVEATCLLLAQSFAVGVDVHLRLSNSSSLISCHSFLLHDFISLYKKGAWPQDSGSQLLREGGKVILELNYKLYTLEILQFVFYSAYGHVLNFSHEELTSQTFALLTSVVKHFTGEQKSICRHLADIPGLLTNLIVLLDRLVRKVAIADATICPLVPDLVALFRVNRLFDELQQRLLDKLFSETTACLEDAGADASAKLQQLHRPNRCPAGDCIYLDVAVNLFKKLVLRSQSSEECRQTTLEASLQAYLSALVDLCEINRSNAMIRACRDLRCISGILGLIGQPCSNSMRSFQSLLVHVCHTLLLLVCDQIVLNFSEALWIHNARFSKRAAFQSQLSLVRQHSMPANTFWNPVPVISRERGLELVLVHFKFTALLAHTVIGLAARLESSGPDDSTESDVGPLQGLHAELSSPEMLDVLNYPTLMQKVEQLQQLLATVSARDMRSVAYASYSTVRMPRMRLVVQMLAILHHSQSQQDVEKILASDASQASEGRQILCTEEALKRLVRDLDPVQLYARSQRNAELWSRLEEFEKSSNCNFGNSLHSKSQRPQQQQQQQQQVCADHGTYHQACLLWTWFRALVSAAAVLRRTSQVFASPDAFRGCIERFIAARPDFFLTHAGDLVGGGEMEPAWRELLVDVLARARRRRRHRPLSRLPPASGEVESTTGASSGRASLSFELQLLPCLQFQFVPHGFKCT